MVVKIYMLVTSTLFFRLQWIECKGIVDFKQIGDQRILLKRAFREKKGVMNFDVYPNGKLWPKSTSGQVEVYYSFENEFAIEDRALITRTMMGITATVPCIDFIESNDSNIDKILFVNGTGCWSWIGRQGGIQELSLSIDGCFSEYIVTHELYHALGCFHEHNRPDRDRFIKVYYENVEPEHVYDFDIIRPEYWGIQDSPYNTDSIMHYSKRAFSKNGLVTITAYSGGKVGGQTPTNQDIGLLNTLYKCGADTNKDLLLSTSEPINESPRLNIANDIKIKYMLSVCYVIWLVDRFLP